MLEPSAKESYSGADAAVAVAEIGLASRRAAKQAWLEAYAALPCPDSGSASQLLGERPEPRRGTVYSS
jgi:hypothetical protein